jgi:hypothetical protein
VENTKGVNGTADTKTPIKGWDIIQNKSALTNP